MRAETPPFLYKMLIFSSKCTKNAKKSAFFCEKCTNFSTLMRESGFGGATMVKLRRFPIMSSGILHKFSNFFCAFCTNFSRNTHRHPQNRSIWLIWLIVLIVFNGAQSVGWARIPREARSYMLFSRGCLIWPKPLDSRNRSRRIAY